jgi:hypothetical protein
MIHNKAFETCGFPAFVACFLLAAHVTADEPKPNPAADKAVFEKAAAGAAWAEVFSDSCTRIRSVPLRYPPKNLAWILVSKAVTIFWRLPINAPLKTGVGNRKRSVR